MNTFPMATSPQKCSKLVKNTKRITATKVEEVEARVLGDFPESQTITAHNFFLPTDLRMLLRYWKPQFGFFLCLRQLEHVFLNFMRGLRPQVYTVQLSEFLDYTPSKGWSATRNLTVLLPRGAGKTEVLLA